MLRQFEHIIRLFILCSFWLIAGVAVSSAQTDTTFWFVAPEVSNSHGDRPVAFRVTSQGQASIVRLSMPANPSFTPVTWNVPANGTRSVIYGNADTINLIENQPHNTLLNKGFLIEASTPITAYYEVVTGNNNPDIFALKGRNALGTDFIVPSQDEMANAHGHERIDIVATENNTQIQVIPTAGLAGVATDTVFITLNRGQTYSVRANSTANNQTLRGTQIKSNKKIAVTIIDDSVRGGDIFGGGGCFDLLGDQLIPTNIIGNDYIAIRGFLNLNPGIREKVYIVAKDNNTQIFINNVNVATLQARQTHEATFASDEMFISSVGGPVYVMHISGFGCETGMAILPPISCTGSTQVGFTRTTNEFFGLYVFTEAGNQGNLILNGNNALLQASDFDTVPNSNNAWVYTRKDFTVGQIPINSGNLLLSSVGKFHMGIINGGATTGCRYGFFSDFARYVIETSTNSNTDAPICQGDTLRVWADSIAGATQYTWNTPLGVVNGREIIIPSLSSANVGMYRAFAIVDGCQSEEDTLYVGMKPLPGNPNARNTGPYCVGDTLRLLADSINNATYNWTGPNGFSSNLRNPILANATVADSGQFQLRVTLNGCTGAIHTTQVSIFPIPSQPNASAIDAALCPGDTLRLQLDSIAGATFQWTGPNGFNSSLRNPVITAMTAAKAGNYLARITVNGCTSIADTVLVSLLPGPLAIAVLSGNTNSCQGDTVALRISPAFGNSYQWFRNGVAIRPGGVNDTLLRVTTTGSYQVEATSIFGCTDTAARIQVTVNAAANVTITPSLSPPTICQGDSINLSVVHVQGYTYQWFFNNNSIPGATDSVVRVNQAGQYTISITDSNNCVTNSAASTVVQVIQPPNAQINPSNTQQICFGSSRMLRANTDTFASYSWFRNSQLIVSANDSLLRVDSAGRYQLVLTYASGCSDTSTITEIILLPRPSSTISHNGDTLLCAGDSIRLAGPASGNLSYRWFRNGILIAGAIDSILFASNSGTYSLEVTNSSGCRDTSTTVSLIAPIIPAPTLIGGASRQLCQGDSLTLRMQPNSTGSLQWFRNGNPITGAIDSQLLVHQTGIYRLQITDTFACSRLGDSIVVGFFPQPIATILPNGPTSFCQGNQVVLQANTAGITNFSWLRNGVLIPGFNDSVLVVNDSAAYQLIVNNTTGCRDTSLTVQTTLFAQPTATISLTTDSILCREDTARLAGPSSGNLSYRWFRNGNLFPGATDSILFTQTSGTYRLEVSNAFGCRDTSTSINLRFQTPAAPGRIGTATRQLCQGDSIILSMRPNGPGQLQWFRNGLAVAAATDSFLRVQQIGQYVMRITDTLGCIRFGDTVAVSFFPQPIAIITPISSTTICAGSQVTLQANSLLNHSYQWLRNGLPIANATTTNLSATQAGLYRVIVTNPQGCFDTAVAVSVQLNPLPVVNVSAGRLIACVGDTIILRATQQIGHVYQWLRNGAAVANAQADSLVTALPGQYVVVVTDSNNCTAVSGQISLQQHPTSSSQVQIQGTLNFCAGDSVSLILTPTAAATYQWFRNGIPLVNDTLTQLTVNSAGNYQVIITSGQGCIDSSILFPVTVFSLPVASILPPANDSLCVGDSLSVQALNTAGLSLQWLRNGLVVPGQTSALLRIMQAGNYQLVVTNLNNCRDTSAIVTVRMRPQPLATLILNGPAQFCQGESSLLQGPVSTNLQYQWFRNGLLLAHTADSLLVTSSGQYILRVVDQFGCSDTAAAVQVIVDTLPIASILPAGIISFCPGAQQILQAPIQAGMNYIWFRNGIQLPGINNPNLVATQAGDYQLVVVNPVSLCRDSSNITQIQLFPQPSVSISTTDSTMRCAGETVNLLANSPDGNLNLQWLRNGSPMNGATNPNFIVIQSGAYQVVATNLQGCHDTSNVISVTMLARPSAAALLPGPFNLCQGEPLTLQMPVQPNVSYQWFNLGNLLPGETNPTLIVSASGIYSCAVNHNNGCGSLSQEIEVTFRTRPNAVSTSSNAPICFGSDLELSASPSPGDTYNWRGPNNFSSTQQNPTLPTAGLLNSGWYYCNVARNGCISPLDSVFVQVEPPIPTFSIKGRTRLCTGNPLELEVEDLTGASYLWTSPDGQQQTGRTFRIAESWLTDSGTYTIALNVNNCPAPPQGVRVSVSDHNFYFPTAFTPNGDGLNEVFKPATFYDGVYDLRIYDRWGALVFQSNDPQAHWDGSVFGSPGAPSAYNYVLFFEGCVREKEMISGTVLLLK